MGYSTNPAVLESRRDTLVELELGRACRWTTKPDRDVTRRKAYEIREALYIASIHADHYPALAQAHKAFSIVIVKPGLIEAKPKVGVELVKLKPAYETPVPVHGIEPFGKPVATVAVTTARQVIDAWAEHLPSLDALNFPQSSLDIVELTVLWNWAVANTPKLMLLVGAGFLTLSLRDADVGDYEWSPPKGVPQEEDFDGRI